MAGGTLYALPPGTYCCLIPSFSTFQKLGLKVVLPAEIGGRERD